MNRMVLALAAVIAITACQTAPESPAPATTDLTVIKSPNDSRDYRYVVLPNQLRVLLVSDIETEQSAAALAVYRGSFHEPKDRAGLAHFLEHMLFIQTEKYPETDGFQKYLAANGGSSNAYTALDHTNYFFDVTPEGFPEALSRWSRFFIDPTLSAEYAAREKNAVHSEYQMQMKDDGWRGYMVGKQALNPAHPGSRFTIGSLSTLAGDIQADLREFFETQYSADQMGLVVLSNDTLDDLEAMVRELFGPIINRNIGPAYMEKPMYAPGSLPIEVANKSERDGADVTFSFPIPNPREVYEAKPQSYIANLLGHEGEGSLHAYLKAQGWIESLGAGVSDFDRNTSVFNVSISLTPEGDESRNKVAEALFQYVEMLRQSEPEAWRFEEQAKVAELNFRYQEKSSPTGFVYRTAPLLDDYPAQDLLVSGYVMRNFEPELIKNYLSYLTPTNVVVEYRAPDAQTNAVEPWFDVPYRIAEIELAAASDDLGFKLPEANPYLPESLELVASDDTAPEFTVQDGVNLWVDTHTDFGAPRTNLRIALAVPDGLLSARDRAMASIYQAMVNDSLNSKTYPAFLAGVSYGIGLLDGGFEVRLGGYVDDELTLLDQVTHALFNTPLPADRFATLKATLIQEWNNSIKARPFRQAMRAVSDTLDSGSWHPTELADVLTDIDLEALAAWREEKLARVGVTALVQGNVDAKAVQSLRNILTRQIAIADVELMRSTALPLEQSQQLALDIDHNDATFVMHLPRTDAAADSFQARAKSALAAQIMRPEYFRLLRTEQQLGYVVSATNRPVIEGRAGMTFVVQSPVASPLAIQQATEAFLDTFLEEFATRTDADLAEHKAGLINRLTEKPKNLAELTGHHWADVLDGNAALNTRQQIADEVAELDKAAMQAYFEELQQAFTDKHLLIYSKGKFAEAPTAG